MHNPYGDTTCIVRRSAFAAVGGFTTDVAKDVGHPDRELLTLLSLAGYRLDVIPEYLLYYRQRANSWLRTSDNYLNDKRVVRHYAARLKEVGLESLAPVAVGQYYAIKQKEEALTTAGMQTWIAQLTQSAEWHKHQSEAWEKTATEQQSHVAGLTESAEWHKHQSEAWEKTATEQQGFIAELREAVEWHQQQSETWERLAKTPPAATRSSKLLAIPRRLRRLARNLARKVSPRSKAARTVA
jgi:hypothetical protein